MKILQATDLVKHYTTGTIVTKALDGVNLTVDSGEFLAIVGSSGSGKTTLLHMMGGLDIPTSGSVKVQNEELSLKNEEQLTVFRRRHIGFVFQQYNLVSVLNVNDNIVLPIKLDANQVDHGYLEEITSMLGISDKMKNMPGELSGGQQQRVAIARAMITKPEIILADEPTGNLDSRTSDDVLSLLKLSSKRFRQTLVMITHNQAVAQLADRIVRIEDGRIVGGGEYHV